MTNQITREELLELITVAKNPDGSWRIIDVYGTVYGDVRGFDGGDVRGTVYGTVYGNVCGDVLGTINGREWQYVETPKEKLERLVIEGATKEQLLEAVNQLEDDQ